MNVPKLAPSLGLALPLLIACDPDSQSLGDEPTENASGSGSGGTGDTPSSAESEQLADFEGTTIQHLHVREDGFVAAAGLSGYVGTFGDLTEYANHWVGALSPDGSVLWQQDVEIWTNQAGERREQAITAIAAAPDGSVWVTIIDYAPFEDALNEAWKFAPDGTRVAQTLVVRRPQAITATADGGAIVAGYGRTVEDDQVTVGWAATLRPDGAFLDSREWSNTDGRSSQLTAVAAADDGFVLGGRWNTASTGSQAQAWLLFIDRTFDDDDAFDDIVVDVKLPASGATDGIRSLRYDDDGNVIASVDVEDTAIMTFSPSGDVLSTELVDPDVVMWSPYSSTGFLGGDRNNCFEQIGGDDCGQAGFSGFDAGERLWDVGIPGCNAVTGYAVDALESVVSVSCTDAVDGDAVVEAQLHRIIAE